MPTAALFTTAKTWRQPKCLLMGECTKKIKWDTHIHTHTHTGILFSHKKKGILPFATTGMILKGIRLSEINQTNNIRYDLHVESKNSKLRDRVRTVDARGWGWRRQGKAGEGYVSVVRWVSSWVQRMW